MRSASRDPMSYWNGHSWRRHVEGEAVGPERGPVVESPAVAIARATGGPTGAFWRELLQRPWSKVFVPPICEVSTEQPEHVPSIPVDLAEIARRASIHRATLAVLGKSRCSDDRCDLCDAEPR